MNDPSTLLQIGVGGLIAYLLVKLILDFLIKNRNNNKDIPVPTVIALTREGVEQILSASVIPILQQQVTILSKIETSQGRMFEMMIELKLSIQELAKDAVAVRDGNHAVRSQLQTIAGKIEELISRR